MGYILAPSDIASIAVSPSLDSFYEKVKLLPVDESYNKPLHIILSRKERMTQPEREIVTEAISHVYVTNLRDLSVGFKENMNVLYEIVFGMEDRETAFSILRLLCQHTGDVLRCVDLLLGRNKYHFHTAQKRFLVKLLETVSSSTISGSSAKPSTTGTSTSEIVV